MPPSPVDRGLPRSATVINEEIRALWARVPLSPGDEVRYRLLLVEWAEACTREGRHGNVRPAA